jgi:outer membrane protein insertion porin family
MLTLSAELRFPIIDQQFYMGVFGDMGNSFNKVKDVDIAQLKKGVGFGFRLMLPMVGLLGFDFSWGLDDMNKALFFESDEPAGFQFNFIMNRGF